MSHSDFPNTAIRSLARSIDIPHGNEFEYEKIAFLGVEVAILSIRRKSRTEFDLCLPFRCFYWPALYNGHGDVKNMFSGERNQTGEGERRNADDLPII